MEKQNEIKIFEDKKVRTLWDAENEKWYFSVIDVIEILTGSPRPRKYWNALKTKLIEEGSELSHKLGQLKMQSADGKFYLTDVADTEQLFRLIQSIPSPKAEPFKQWLAKVAAERLDEMQDPELSIDRALQQYLNLGYSENWINQRLKSIEIRKELTDEWKKRGLKEGVQFATLTDIITKAWSDNTTKEYKMLKGLKKENLRDNMTNTELILNMLAEASTKDISAATNPKDFDESKKVAKQGLKRSTFNMKKAILILGFILIIIGCIDKKKDKPALNEAAKDTVLANSNESSSVYNESEAIWGIIIDTLTGDEELKQLKPVEKEVLTGEMMEKIVNKTWPRVQIKYLGISNDTAYISIPDSEILTQQMGSEGAESFMISTVYSFTEIKGVKYVSFDFEFGDHANPGVYNRNSWDEN